MKIFLCVEDNEFFTIEAENLKEAQETASMWNASVVKELKELNEENEGEGD